MDNRTYNKSPYVVRTIEKSVKYIAGIYMRLSQDDGERGESNSITSQRMIARSFAKLNNIAVYDEYIDDGWSGTNFDRPGFQRIISDIEAGKINCVITKDLSRLGRNYILTGQYTEMYFPRKGIRYIAIDDGVDSVKGESEIAPFKNIINEWYARDTSKKVRSANNARFAAGERYMATPILGYKRVEDKNAIEPDEETAPIVHKLFELASLGWGCRRIQEYMDSHGYPTPAQVNYERSGMYAWLFEGKDRNDYPKWDDTTIRRLLRDETYIGNTVHFRQGTVSFKDHHRVRKPVSDWRIVEHTHEPLIDEEVFRSVQKKLEGRKHKYSSTGKENIFAGIVKCADCGRSLCVGYSNTCKAENRRHLKCLTYMHHGKDACTVHYIKYKDLYEYVLARLQFWIDAAHIKDEELAAEIENSQKRSRDKNSLDTRGKISKLEKRLEDIDALFVKLYDDRLDGKLSDRNFDMLSSKYQAEQGTIQDHLSELRSQLEKDEPKEDGFSKWINLVKTYTHPTALTTEMLNTLIDKIVVHERQRTEDGKFVQKVIIYYKFLGQVD